MSRGRQRTLCIKTQLARNRLEIPVDMQVALSSNFDSVMRRNRLVNDKSIFADYVQIQSGDIGVGKRQTRCILKTQSGITHTDLAYSGCNGKRQTISRNASLRQLTFDVGHHDAVGTQGHVRTTRSRQNTHIAIDFGQVDRTLSGQRQPTVRTD